MPFSNSTTKSLFLTGSFSLVLAAAVFVGCDSDDTHITPGTEPPPDAATTHQPDASTGELPDAEAHSEPDASRPDANPPRGPLPVTRNGNVATVTLISPASCADYGFILQQCAISETHLEAPLPLPSGRVVTELRLRLENYRGHRFLPELNVTYGDGLEKHVVVSETGVVRIDTVGYAPITGLTLVGENEKLGRLSIIPDSRVYLDIAFNVPEPAAQVTQVTEDKRASDAGTEGVR